MDASIQQFLAALTESGLLSAEEVASVYEALPPAERPKDAQELARNLVRARKLTRYQATAIYQGKPKGLLVGEYAVLDKLGAGGMGVVLRARHRKMHREVALKVLSAAAMKKKDAVDRFQREVRAAARLMHPNIVTAYDAGQHEGWHYLVLE
jgi:serine/threonine-protein kinase